MGYNCLTTGFRTRVPTLYYRDAGFVALATEQVFQPPCISVSLLIMISASICETLQDLQSCKINSFLFSS